jgi:hypothetical protein
MALWILLIHFWSNKVELLNDMALFVEVAKAKGFRGAAEVLGMPNSTLSRRISALEKAIGLRLLHRTTRKVELTEAGQIYFERCKRIVDEARLAHEQLGEMLAQPTGVLRVSLPVDFAITYLAPLIAEFADLYPGITHGRVRRLTTDCPAIGCADLSLICLTALSADIRNAARSRRSGATPMPWHPQTRSLDAK